MASPKSRHTLNSTGGIHWILPVVLALVIIFFSAPSFSAAGYSCDGAWGQSQFVTTLDECLSLCNGWAEDSPDGWWTYPDYPHDAFPETGTQVIHSALYSNGNPYNLHNPICNYPDATLPDCSLGEVWDVDTQQCVPDGSSCVAGTQFTTSASSPGADSTCIDGCWHSISGDGLEVSDGAGGYLVSYVNTGNTCAPDANVIPSPPDQCITGANGVEICLRAVPTNCGTFNGLEGCAEDIPKDGTCHLLGDGGYICDTATPPDNADSTPQKKLGEITGDADNDGTNETADIYSDGATGLYRPNKEKIDETGVPTGTDSMFGDAFDLIGLNDFEAAIGTEVDTVAGIGDAFNLDFNVDFGWIDSANCTSSTYYVAGHPFDFPGARGCTFLAGFKQIVGWFFYVMTGIYLFKLTLTPVRAK